MEKESICHEKSGLHRLMRGFDFFVVFQRKLGLNKQTKKGFTFKEKSKWGLCFYDLPVNKSVDMHSVVNCTQKQTASRKCQRKC